VDLSVSLQTSDRGTSSKCRPGRRLYNQFTSKKEIFREMLLRVSGQLEDAFSPGIETQGDVGEVLRLVARMILELHRHPEYPGFLRMVVADARQFPWIAEEFAAVMEPQTERLARYIAPPDSNQPDERGGAGNMRAAPAALVVCAMSLAACASTWPPPLGGLAGADREIGL